MVNAYNRHTKLFKTPPRVLAVGNIPQPLSAVIVQSALRGYKLRKYHNQSSVCLHRLHMLARQVREDYHNWRPAAAQQQPRSSSYYYSNMFVLASKRGRVGATSCTWSLLLVQIESNNRPTPTGSNTVDGLFLYPLVDVRGPDPGTEPSQANHILRVVATAIFYHYILAPSLCAAKLLSWFFTICIHNTRSVGRSVVVCRLGLLVTQPPRYIRMF